jgi:hypothetical protein
MGLPCGHDLILLTRSKVPIPLESVHRHWWFNPADAPLPSGSLANQVLDPVPSVASQGQRTSTRREASHWERIYDAVNEEERGAYQSRRQKQKRSGEDYQTQVDVEEQVHGKLSLSGK